MSGCVARRAAAIGSLILPAVAPAAAHHPGSGGKTGSGGPINIISIISPDTLAEGQIAAAARSEFIRLGQLDDAALLAGAEHGSHTIRSIEIVSLAVPYGIDNMVATRIPHMRRSDIRKAAEEHGDRPRPNNDVVAADARPANGSRTVVAPFRVTV